MKLFLMRHGDADDGHIDAMRPLSKKGVKEAERAGAFLAIEDEAPGLICHSDLLRARQTAEIVAERLGLSQNLCERSGLRPDDSAAYFAKEIAGDADRADDLLIVGHMPFMADLASCLLSGVENAVSMRFTTGSLLCLERSGYGEWTQRYHISARLIARFLAS